MKTNEQPVMLTGLNDNVLDVLEATPEELSRLNLDFVSLRNEYLEHYNAGEKTDELLDIVGIMTLYSRFVRDLVIIKRQIVGRSKDNG